MTGTLPDAANRPARLVAETRTSARDGLANAVGLCSRTLRSELGAASAGPLRKYQ